MLSTLTKQYGVKIYNGNFSIVVSTPDKDYVYKVWHSDPSFEDYYNFCVKNQDLACVIPMDKKGMKIREIKLPTIRDISAKNTSIKIVKLPKLLPITDPKDFSYMFIDNVDISEDLEDICTDIIRGKPIGSRSLSTDNSTKNCTYDGIKFFDSLDKYFQYTPHKSDLNFDNFMKTPDGKIIVTDPVYTDSKTKQMITLMDPGSNLRTVTGSPRDHYISVSGRKGSIINNIFGNDARVDEDTILAVSELSDAELSKLTKDQAFDIMSYIPSVYGLSDNTQKQKFSQLLKRLLAIHPNEELENKPYVKRIILK